MRSLDNSILINIDIVRECAPWVGHIRHEVWQVPAEAGHFQESRKKIRNDLREEVTNT